MVFSVSGTFKITNIYLYVKALMSDISDVALLSDSLCKEGLIIRGHNMGYKNMIMTIYKVCRAAYIIFRRLLQDI